VETWIGRTILQDLVICLKNLPSQDWQLYSSSIILLQKAMTGMISR